MCTQVRLLREVRYIDILNQHEDQEQLLIPEPAMVLHQRSLEFHEQISELEALGVPPYIPYIPLLVVHWKGTHNRKTMDQWAHQSPEWPGWVQHSRFLLLIQACIRRPSHPPPSVL